MSVNALVAKLLGVLAVDLPVVHGDPRPGDVRRHSGAPALGEQLTGFCPGGRLEEGLAETVAWYRERLALAPVTHDD